ncbi:MAG: phosphoribosylaminoimidazolesuccinocarboxamide synthase [Polynucleobacter sp.]|nr:phosphoribosylaminoimidazolesuccinocarboxamide synthase [Polynucleobacter sp.]
MNALHTTSITSLPLLSKGKVRDVYEIGSDRLLMITTDRLSAFDVILPQPIPEKGIILNQMANFWFDRLAHVVPNHLTGIDPVTVVKPEEADQVRGRAVVAKRLKPILVEAVVRGYLAGSGWKDYQETGSVCGVALAPGLQNAQKLDKPIFTPAAKSAMSEHDENISFEEVVGRIGAPLANQIRDVSIRLYEEASRYAASRGIIIADTKFEFGLDQNNQLVLMDEILTADSSRFWPAETYQVGTNPPSYDKQFVRDWLESVRIDGKPWSKAPPAPDLPAEVIAKTAEKYREALVRLTQAA